MTGGQDYKLVDSVFEYSGAFPGFLRPGGLSPSCAFAVFARPFREIYAAMAMAETRQSEGALLIERSSPLSPSDARLRF